MFEVNSAYYGTKIVALVINVPFYYSRNRDIEFILICSLTFDI